MLIWLTSYQTEPPVEVPTNFPTALSVVSVTTKSNWKAPKYEPPTPPFVACNEQVAHVRRKSPKLMLDGVPLLLAELGVNVIVAGTPNVSASVKPPLVIAPLALRNSVSPEFVV
jgi:hypothetical protein